MSRPFVSLLAGLCAVLWLAGPLSADGLAVPGGNVVGPGSVVSGNVATFSGTTGKALTDGGKALPSGAVVGTTDTQTLTNKSIDASQVNSGTLAAAQGGTGDTGTAWTTYTPTITAGSGTITTASATGRYKKIGRVVFLQVSITITTNGTGATNVTATLPTAPAAVAVISGKDTGVTGKMLEGFINTAASGSLAVQFYDASYPGANGAVLLLSGVYESTS